MGDLDDRRRVFIQLSEDQVDGVIAHVNEVDGPAMPTDGSPTPTLGTASTAGGSTQWVFRPLMDDKSYSRSLLIGLEVLTCFPLDGTERGVADVAQQLRMTNSTVHRYMLTLLRVGLLERNPDTRWYRITSGQSSGSLE